MSTEKPLATCQDCGKRFQFTGSELDAEVCDACVELDDIRDVDAYGAADIDNSMGVGEWD
jgi:hypothetical protein